MDLIKTRYEKSLEPEFYMKDPPFPKLIQFETTTVCNQKCIFCERPKKLDRMKLMPLNWYFDISKEAYDLGAREIGLHAGSEPFIYPMRPFVGWAKQLGYEYIFLSTNADCKWERLHDAIYAGLNSIKISLNAINEDTYKKVHGKYSFNQVLDNIFQLSKLKKYYDFHLAICFIHVPGINDGHLDIMRDQLHCHVDEIFDSHAVSQMQNPSYPPRARRKCDYPFMRAVITVEGYLRVCCNDYHNQTVIADIKEVPLIEAWHSEKYKTFRKDFIERKFCSLCKTCIGESS